MQAGVLLTMEEMTSLWMLWETTPASEAGRMSLVCSFPATTYRFPEQFMLT
jgi:hypothetical protein